ncbi:hypothetical protein [Hymenobacter canadensis]|uniref:TIGR03751 family conjugal transfer lipoprotein n=1 Tax=Hymenobacter canadensis TaxID=2999067 RepID=A0ABY7LQC1_9BACT|nr:hypothetical protein [Hymenobacter canadensis]WBA41093.1 hypothetical protein O3303_14855 [Hymenobacter canadensis]
MKFSPVAILSFLVLGCSHSASFDQEVWLQNPGVEDTRNPRAYMVQDVLKNHLRAGMPREAVVALLGSPYKEGVEQRLPKEVVVPDSLSASNPENLKPENQDKFLAAFNAFMRLPSRPDTVLLYPVGWSTIDPNFLVVKLTGKGKVENCWVEQH